MDRDPENMSREELKKVLLSEDHYRCAVDALHYVLWRADPTGKIIHKEGKLPDALGLELPDLIGDQWIDSIHPEDKERVVAQFREAIETSQPMEFNCRILDGERIRQRWAKIAAKPKRNHAGEIIVWYGIALDITEEMTKIESQRILLQELNHRVKNSLTTVQSIVLQTLRSLSDEDEHSIEAYQRYCDKVMERLQTLSSAHDLLTENQWRGAGMSKVFDRALQVIMSPLRFDISGPAILLDANAVVLLSMMAHELGTNAVKYGAWKNDHGKVLLTWEVDRIRGDLTVTWQESGGPKVVPPERRGFGSKLIKNGLRELGGSSEMIYGEDGVRCTMNIRLSGKVKTI